MLKREEPCKHWNQVQLEMMNQSSDKQMKNNLGDTMVALERGFKNLDTAFQKKN